jgi:hypothetical protein
MKDAANAFIVWNVLGFLVFFANVFCPSCWLYQPFCHIAETVYQLQNAEKHGYSHNTVSLSW